MALLGILLDQGSKYGIFAWLYNDGRGGSFEVLPGAFSLTAEFDKVETETGLVPKVETETGLLATLRTLGGDVLPRLNKGALFGTTLHMSPESANLLFALISLSAALGIIVWSTRPSARRDSFLCFALGLILAGAVGNLYDRIVFGGVRDFLWWYYLVNWPVFNIADCCLVVGAGLMLLEAFLTTKEMVAAPPAETVQSTERQESLPHNAGVGQG
ncbi:MAG: signal peptidase II [Gemmataceae bacterium]|nr:signal peptidase II [Gemmataceae bacterium]